MDTYTPLNPASAVNFPAGAYLYITRNEKQLIAIVEWYRGRSRVRFFTLVGEPTVFGPRKSGRPKRERITLDAVLANGYLVPLVPHGWKWSNGFAGMDSVAKSASDAPAKHRHNGVQHYYECLDRDSGYCEIRWHEPVNGVEVTPAQ